MKTNPMRGDEIEFAAEIGQGSLSFDPADDARNFEQGSRGAEKRLAVSIEAENLVAEKFADVEEVTGAGANIDNAHWRRAIQPKILRALDVNLDPIDDIFEPIDLGRARPIRKLVTKFFELCAIERFQDALFVDRVRQSAEMFERAGEEIGRK